MSNISNNTNNTNSTGNVHTARIRRKTVKRPLAIIVTIIMLLSSVVPIMAMADSSIGGGIASEQSTEEQTPVPDTPVIPDITPLSIPSNALTVTVNNTANTSIVTTGDTAPSLKFGLKVNVNEANLSGITIEIPLDWTPIPGAAPYYSDFTSTAPFFKWEDVIFPNFYNESMNPNEIITSCEITSTRLIVHLRDNLPTNQLDTVGVFEFPLNEYYLKKVPSATRLWSIAPEVCHDGNQANTAAPVNVNSSSHPAIPTITSSKQTPTGNDYSGGGISFSSAMNIQSGYLILDSDETPNFSAYIDVPDGTTLGEALIDKLDGVSVPTPNTVGYTRYYSSMALTGNYALVPPAMPDGTTFHIGTGYIVKRINEAQREFHSDLDYTKFIGGSSSSWGFNKSTYHIPNAKPQLVNHVEDVSNADNIPVSVGYGVVGTNIFTNANAIKNTGDSPVTGVSLVLYQAEAGVPKVNFSKFSIYLFRDISDTTNIPAWTKYRLEYNIKSATGGLDRNGVFGTIYSPTTSATAGSANLNVNAPNLDPGEYIDEIIFTPLGTDGTSEGTLSYGNGFSLWYQTKSWQDKQWPDGTPMGDLTAVPMKYTVYYNNEEGGQSPDADSYDGDVLNTYYYRGAINTGEPRFTSTNANSVAPGQTVNYTLSWFVSSSENYDSWSNPMGVARFPACMELTDLGNKDLIDANGTHAGIVVVEKLLGSDSTYTYYRFSVPGYTIEPGYTNLSSSVGFTVLLNFMVKPGTAGPVTYQITNNAGSIIDAQNFTSLSEKYDRALTPNATAYGFGEGDHWWGDGNSAYNTSLVVRSVTNMGSKTSVNGAGTGNTWVDYTTGDDAVPALLGETVRVKTTIANAGNVGYNKFRLYAILPQVNDALGTVGGSAVKFLGFEGLPGDATVYYYTGSQSIGEAQLPSYGDFGSASNYDPALQTYNFGSGWTTATPSNMNTVKAVRVVFNTATTINYGEELGITMLYEMDSTVAQTINTQFRYSAVPTAGTATPWDSNSEIAAFSSDTIALIYNSNLPGNRVAADLADLPDNETASGGVLASAFDVSATEPTLDGYDFAGWNTDVDGNGDSYDATDTLPMIQTGSIVLYAQWTPKDVAIDYNLLGKISTFIPAPGSASAKFGDVLTDPNNPLSVGYTFTGWYQVDPLDGLWAYANAAYTLGSTNDMNGHNYHSTKTLYAGWTTNEYTVKYDDNYSETGSIIATESGKNIGNTVNIPGSSRPHYKFLGFSTDENANIPDVCFGRTDSDFTLDADAIVSLFTNDTETEITLYAVWQDTYNIRFVSGTGAAASVAAVWEDVEEGTLWSAAGVMPTPASLDSHWINPVWSGTLPEGSSQIIANATYTLNYSRDSHTVIYEDAFHNSGTVPGADTKTHGETVTIAGQGDLVHTGYAFLGWNEDASATVATYAAGSNIIDIDANYTLHGIWRVNSYQYTITHHFDGGTKDGTQTIVTTEQKQFGQSASADTSVTYTGYSLNAAHPSAIPSGVIGVNGLALHLYYQANSYTVSYSAGGSDVTGLPSNATITYGDSYTVSSVAPSRSGYTFNGWVATSGISGNYNGGESFTMPASDVVLTASWTDVPTEPPIVTPTTYTVSYDGGGDNVTGLPSGTTLKEGDSYTVSGDIPVRDGYTFEGWVATSGINGNYSSGNSFTMPASDVVLTASWKAVPTVPPVVDPPIDPPVVNPVSVTHPSVVTPEEEPIEEAIAEPNEPEVSEPTTSTEKANVDVKSQSQRKTEAKLDAQTGNPILDLFKGNVPLGNVKFEGAWSLLSMLMSLVAVVVSVLLVLGVIVRRRYEDEIAGRARNDAGYNNDAAGDYRRRGKILRVLTIVLGVLTPVVWFVLDTLNQKVVWINKFTVYVGIVFVATVVLLVVYKVWKGDEKREVAEV